jgi:hypothetical protein
MITGGVIIDPYDSWEAETMDKMDEALTSVKAAGMPHR